jgi:hypothetical protein
VIRDRRVLTYAFARCNRAEAGDAMTRPARVREPEVLAEAMAALCAESKRTGSRFSLGALDALADRRRTSPLTGQMAEKPVPVRPVARELAVAEGQTYGRNRQQSQYAQGVLHALMWAQYATAAPRRRPGAFRTDAPSVTAFA